MKYLKSLNAELYRNDNLNIDIRYADDTKLLTVVFKKLRTSTKELESARKMWGMKIKGAKCKIISPQTSNIATDGKTVEVVEQFVLLGISVSDSSTYVSRRIALAAFGWLYQSVWSQKKISRSLKVRLYRALVLPIVIYASETWTLKAEDYQKREAFEMRCLRAIPAIPAIPGVSLRDRCTALR